MNLPVSNTSKYYKHKSAFVGFLAKKTFAGMPLICGFYVANGEHLLSVVTNKLELGDLLTVFNKSPMEHFLSRDGFVGRGANCDYIFLKEGGEWFILANKEIKLQRFIKLASYRLMR